MRLIAAVAVLLGHGRRIEHLTEQPRHRLDHVHDVQRRIEEDHGTEPNLLDEAAARLDKLVAQAAAEGVTADRQVSFGKSWVQLIRQVLKASHDLVVVGTRHAGPVAGFLIGSTAITENQKTMLSAAIMTAITPPASLLFQTR